MITPVITIFVRHSPGCKYAGDEFSKRCNCRKHLRWTQNGQQFRRKAGTRSWSEAEEQKRRLEDQLAGRIPSEPTAEGRTIADAIEVFKADKKNQGVTDGVIGKYSRELDRLKAFAEDSKVFTVAGLSRELLIEYQAGWDALYPSSNTRQQVQARLKHFIRFCYDNRWLERVPRLSTIKADEAPTLPLSQAEYTKLLARVPKEFEGTKASRVRALIQLMRWTGLAIRDAVTLERRELVRDTKKKIYRVATARQKTGTPVSVPLPDDIAAEVLAVMNGNEKYIFWTGGGLETSAVTNWQHDLRTLFRATFGQNTHFTPHCLRDTAAVEWLSAGVPLEEVSKLLGHTSVKTTERSYSPWVTARQDRLDSLVTGTWKKRRN
jgi:site-specific recombinase XerD